MTKAVHCRHCKSDTEELKSYRRAALRVYRCKKCTRETLKKDMKYRPPGYIDFSKNPTLDEMVVILEQRYNCLVVTKELFEDITNRLR